MRRMIGKLIRWFLEGAPEPFDEVGYQEMMSLQRDAREGLGLFTRDVLNREA